MRNFVSGLVVLLLVALGVPSAHAFSGGSNITCVNGSCAFSGTLPVANGGTNLTTATDDNVMVGNGTTWQSKAITTCTGTGKAVTYDASTNAFGCNTIGAGVNPVIPFEIGMDATTSQTLYVAPGGAVDTTEAVITTPMPAATFGNLRCLNSAIQGTSNNIVVTVRTGTAGALSDSTMTCTITGSASANQSCSDTSNTATTTAGQVLSVKVVTPATLSANARVNCILERTA